MGHRFLIKVHFVYDKYWVGLEVCQYTKHGPSMFSVLRLKKMTIFALGIDDNFTFTPSFVKGVSEDGRPWWRFILLMLLVVSKRQPTLT